MGFRAVSIRGKTMKGIQMKSIQTKLTLSILVIFLVALGVLGGLNYWKARSIITENITADMAKQATMSAGDVGDWLASRKAEMTVISVAPAVLSGDRAAIVPFLRNVAQANKVYDALGYALPSGQAVNSAGIELDLSDRDYFKQALKGEAAVSDPVLSKTTNHLIAVVAIPVKVDGKVTGVIYGLSIWPAWRKRCWKSKSVRPGTAMCCKKTA